METNQITQGSMNPIEENLRAVGVDVDAIMKRYWSIRLETGGRIQEEWETKEEAQEFFDSGKVQEKYNQRGNVIYYDFRK